MRRRIRFAVIGLFAACVLAGVVAAFLHSERLDAVTVRFTGPGAEPEDVHIPGRAKDDVKPDYRLAIVTDRGSITCGTVWDTSAAAGIRFAVDVRLREVRELVLVEHDSLSDDDPVARVAFSPPSMSAKGYVFSVASSRSFSQAVLWFLGTPIGIAVLIVAALLFLYILRELGRSVMGFQSPQDPGGLEPPDLDLPDISP